MAEKLTRKRAIEKCSDDFGPMWRRSIMLKDKFVEIWPLLQVRNHLFTKKTLVPSRSNAALLRKFRIWTPEVRADNSIYADSEPNSDFNGMKIFFNKPMRILCRPQSKVLLVDLSIRINMSFVCKKEILQQIWIVFELFEHVSTECQSENEIKDYKKRILLKLTVQRDSHCAKSE